MLEINTLGLNCPLPLLNLKKALRQYPEQQDFILKSSDPNSKIDLSRYCELHQLAITLLDDTPENELHYIITRK